MKKLLLLVCFTLLLFGCNKKNEDIEIKTNSFKLSKVDEKKDYVYSKVLGIYLLPNNTSYNMEEIIVNLNSGDASNINLELRSFVNKSKVYVSDNVFLNGYIYDYKYYVTDNYLSLVVNYKYITNGVYDDEDSLVYVLSMKDGSVVSKSDLLKAYELSEDDMFKKVENNIKSEDVLYSMKSIKDNYYLYVNKDNKLVVIFYEATDEEQIKRELILN